MKIEVIVLDIQVQKFKKSVIEKSRRLAGLLRKKGVIEVYLAGGKRMRKLNKKFLKKDRDTNVISLVSPDNFPDLILGEAYLNPLFIEKNGQDLDLMLAHGVLHILGYDHEKKNDRLKMEAKENLFLSKLKT